MGKGKQFLPFFANSLHRHLHSTQSEMARHYTAKEWYRQVLAKDCSKVCCLLQNLTNILIVDSTIKQDEKLAIRGRLIKSAVDETVNELLVQNALLISKIVRLEFPTDW